MRSSKKATELSKTIAKVLVEGGFESEGEAMRDLSLTIALSQLSKYEREYERFKRKYHLDFVEFSQRVERETGREDFAVEDDLNDWEFAWRALRLWRERVEILKNA